MNKTRRRSARARWAQIAALAALIVMLQAPMRAAVAAERLRVAHSTLTATNSVLWVARDRGIFPRHGLDVSLIYVAGVRSMQALLAQEVEIGSVSGTTAIQANLSGADSVIIGGISNSVLMSLVATPDITAVEALRGKRVRRHPFRFSFRFHGPLLLDAGWGHAGPGCRHSSDRRVPGKRGGAAGRRNSGGDVESTVPYDRHQTAGFSRVDRSEPDDKISVQCFGHAAAVRPVKAGRPHRVHGSLYGGSPRLQTGTGVHDWSAGPRYAEQ